MAIAENSNEYERFQPGDHIVMRNVFDGRVQTVFASIVVVDTPELVGIWIPLSAPIMNGVSDPSIDFDTGKGHLSAESVATKDWTMVPRTWHTAGTLRLKNPRAMWSLWVFWDEGLENVRGWYINIDSPYERTRFGFDTWDMFLDVAVEADRKSWRYKDEDEFSDAIKAGLFTEREAEEVRATAAQALEIIKSNRTPFDNVWEKWRPDLLWEMPQLPEDWERV